MHAEQLAHVIAIERDEVRDLLSLRLGEAQPLTSFDLEADVSTGRNRSRHPRFQYRGRTAHLKKILPVVRITDASKASRVGKIACRICAAWARRARDFAHAERSSVAPLPTLQTALNRLLWWASYRTTALSASRT
jgi:hypothetical protein